MNEDNLRRNIEDNLDYRKTKADVDRLTREIESLEEKVLKIGRLASIEAEIVRLSQERERLLSEVYSGDLHKVVMFYVICNLSIRLSHYIHLGN